MPNSAPAGNRAEVPFDIRERTFLFSVRSLQWVRTLPRDMGTQIAAKQFLEAATSIGANIEEATGADTTRDRVYKWAISRKEAREARYWIRLLYTASLDSPEARALEQEATEFIRILSTLINKGKASLGKNDTP